MRAKLIGCALRSCLVDSEQSCYCCRCDDDNNEYDADDDDIIADDDDDDDYANNLNCTHILWRV